MNIRKTHPNDTTSISLDYFDVQELLKNGFTNDKSAGAKIALDDTGKDALIERDTEIFKKGQMDNSEVKGVIGKIHYAIRIAEGTAGDYERLANELKETDPAAYLEFASMAAGIREAVVNLKAILLEQSDAKQD